MSDALHVLIVDDSETDRAWSRRLLERDRTRRWIVAEAASPNEAEDALRAGGIDAVLLDLHLPDGEGAALLQRLRAAARGPLGWVMLTGAGDEELATEMLKAGAHDYLPKRDLAPQRLRQALAQAAERARLRAAAEVAQERLGILVEVWPELAPQRDPRTIASFVTARAAASCRCEAAFELVDDTGAATPVARANERGPVELDAPFPQRPAYRPSELEEVGRTLGDGATWLAMPARRRGRTWGVLLLWRPAGTGWPRGDRAFAGALADRAAVALDRSALFHDLQEALHTRDELVSMASHDLRTPLTMIQATAESLERRPDDPAHVARQAARILRSTRAMTRLVEEILDTARIQQGGSLPLRCVAFDLVAVVHEKLQQLEALSTSHRFVFHAAPGSLPVRLDLARIDRVLDNLIGNAIKYSPAGGTVAIRLLLHGDEVVLSVRDEGIGIPAGDLPRIFERYHRAKNAASRFAGSGIGLSSAARVVEAHGGRIEVESAEGSGTTFTVHLPLTGPCRPGDREGA
ncbi:sensor histidine kinase [Vulgatibacter sp.]|uniref:sensor histidine kinase n=1 Tax=Vulgatibacter sp. TaxID=1971226 RepID=UPI003562DA9C